MDDYKSPSRIKNRHRFPWLWYETCTCHLHTFSGVCLYLAWVMLKVEIGYNDTIINPIISAILFGCALLIPFFWHHSKYCLQNLPARQSPYGGRRQCEVKFLCTAFKLSILRLLFPLIALLPGIGRQLCKLHDTYLVWPVTIPIFITHVFLLPILIASVPSIRGSYRFCWRELLRACYFLIIDVSFPRSGWLIMLLTNNCESYDETAGDPPSDAEKVLFLLFVLSSFYFDIGHISDLISRKNLTPMFVELLGDVSMIGLLLIVATRGRSRLFGRRKFEILASAVLFILLYLSIGSILLLNGKEWKLGFEILKSTVAQKMRVFGWLGWIKMRPGKELKYVVLFHLLLCFKHT